jgi:hypothetical protein
MEKTLALTVNAPSQVTTLAQAEEAVEWLRAKKQFDASVDSCYGETIKLAHRAHKSAIAAAKKIKEPSDTMAAEVRAHLEVYAENPSHPLPSGIYRREHFNVYVAYADEVPGHYKTPDLALIRAFVKHTAGAIPIPGVVIEKEVRVTIQGDDNE